MNQITYYLVLFGITAASLIFAEEKPTYELIRLTHNDGKTEAHYAVRCHVFPTAVKYESDAADLHSEQTLTLSTDAKKVQALVDKVKGIARPDFTKASKYTNWWVISKAGNEKEAKLIRSNLDGQVLEDESEEAKKLTAFMGTTCFSKFGQ